MKNRITQLFLVILLLVGSISGTATFITGHAAAEDVNGTLLAGTNQQRYSAGLSGLNLNYQLASAAQSKAADMVANNYWSHVSPSGAQPWDFISSSGYDYYTAGENLAYGYSSLSAVISGWMNSPEHRANMLNSSFMDVGFGVAYSANFQGQGPQTIVVAEYGARYAAPAPAPVYTAPATTYAPEPSASTQTYAAQTAPADAAAPVETAAPVEQPAEGAPAATAEPTPTATPTPTPPATASKSDSHSNASPKKVKQVAYLKSSNRSESASPWLAFIIIALGLSAPGFYAYRRRDITNKPTFNPMSYVIY